MSFHCPHKTIQIETKQQMTLKDAKKYSLTQFHSITIYKLQLNQNLTQSIHLKQTRKLRKMRCHGDMTISISQNKYRAERLKTCRHQSHLSSFKPVTGHCWVMP